MCVSLSLLYISLCMYVPLSPSPWAVPRKSPFVFAKQGVLHDLCVNE